MKSWARNKFQFWSVDPALGCVDPNAARFAMWQSGLMRDRDKANVYYVITGCVMFVTWCGITFWYYSELEAYCISTAGVVLVSTVLPILAARQHKSANSFNNRLVIYGMVLALIINGTFKLHHDSWGLATITLIWYTGMCLMLVLWRHEMTGWRNHRVLVSVDKYSVVPFFATLFCISQWYKDVHGSDETARETIYYVLLMTCFSLGLLAAFFYLFLKIKVKYQDQQTAKRVKANQELRMKYLNLDKPHTDEQSMANIKSPALSRVETLSPVKSGLFSHNEDAWDKSEEQIGLLEDEQRVVSKGVGRCQSFLSEFGTRFVICVTLLLVGSVVGVEMYALSRDSKYEGGQRCFYCLTAICGTLFVMSAGLCLVCNQAAAVDNISWCLASESVLPVVVPYKDEQGFDFTKPVSFSNIPFGCGISSLLVLLLWGISATILPSVDFIFDECQMTAGVIAIAFSISLMRWFPYYLKLSMNYSISQNYKYLVTKPSCMAPVTNVERILYTQCKEYTKENPSKKKSLDMDSIWEISTKAFRPCFVQSSFAGTDLPEPREYNNQNNYEKSKPDKGKVFPRDLFDQAARDIFPDIEEFTVNQFMMFFKMHCLGLGSLTFDDSFLEEKRNWSLKELKTCNALLTRGADSYSSLTAGLVFTSAQIEYTMVQVLYPEAVRAVCGLEFLMGGCASGSKSERRDKFKQIFKAEKMSTLLYLEKLCFEGHFTLAVAFCVHEAKRIDDMAVFKLRHARGEESYANEDSDEISGEQVGSVGCYQPLPLEEFKNPIAKTVYDSGYDPESVSHDVRLPERRDQNYKKALALIKQEMTNGSIANRIWVLHRNMRFLQTYLAEGCAPAPAEGYVPGNDIQPHVKIIDSTHWDEIFGNLTSGKTVGDLHKNIESLYECWIKLFDPPSWKPEDAADTSSTVCFDELEAPVVYACALLLEFYDVAMFAAMFASGATRYG